MTPETENRGIDDELFNLLSKRWESTPIYQTLDISLTYLGQGVAYQTLDISLTYLGQGVAGLKMSAGQEFTTIRGRLHGGVTATLADTAMGWAIITLGRTCVTVDMYMNYFAPCFWENELIAEANVIHSGKRTVVAEATLCNGKGDIVVKSRGTFHLKGNLHDFEPEV